MNSVSLFDWIMLAMGAYVLYAGISGKGRLYNTDKIKEGMEEKLKKLMRRLYIALGILMSLNAGASIVKYLFYTAKEVAPAVEGGRVTFEWVPIKDLGSFSFLTPQVLDIISYVCLGLCIAGLVVLMVSIRKMTEKNVPQRQAAQSPEAARQAGHILPTSAFEFDQDEPQDPVSAR